MSTLKGLVEKASREASRRVVEMLGEQLSVWEIMKEEASAREGFVALTSPEAGGKRRGANGHVYWGLQDTFTLQCGSGCWQQNLGMQGHEMQRKSVLSAGRQEMTQ